MSMAAGARLVMLAIKVARVLRDLKEGQGLLEMRENLEKAYLVLMEQMEKMVSRGVKVGFIIRELSAGVLERNWAHYFCRHYFSLYCNGIVTLLWTKKPLVISVCCNIFMWFEVTVVIIIIINIRWFKFQGQCKPLEVGSATSTSICLLLKSPLCFSLRYERRSR